MHHLKLDLNGMRPPSTITDERATEGRNSGRTNHADPRSQGATVRQAGHVASADASCQSRSS
jgi:hypothetical protein